MAKVLIIGGGLAGISAAVKLCSKHQITLLEQTDRLGGKIKHSYDVPTQTYYDIGQHLLLFAYKSTNEFLDIIKADKSFFEFNEIKFFFNNNIYKLNISYDKYMLLLVNNIVKSKIFNIKDILELIYDASKISLRKNIKRKDSKIYNFLNLFAASIFNTDIENVDTERLKNTFKLIIKKNNFIPLLPKTTLENLLVKPATNYLFEKDVKIHLKESVKNVDLANNIIKKVYTNNCSYDDFDYVVFALPYNQLAKLLNFQIKVQMNDILTVYFFIDRLLDLSMIGNLNSNPVWDWMFSYNNIISFVKSNNKINEIDIDYFTKLAKMLLHNDDIRSKNYKIINYKNATPVQDVNFNKIVSKINKLENAIIVGDWIYKNLPCTIETAIKSGLEININS